MTESKSRVREMERDREREREKERERAVNERERAEIERAGRATDIAARQPAILRMRDRRRERDESE